MKADNFILCSYVSIMLKNWLIFFKNIFKKTKSLSEFELIKLEMKKSNYYNKARNTFYKVDYRGKWATNYENEVEYDNTVNCRSTYESYLCLTRINPILEKHGLCISDEDWMGATGWSLWKDNKKIKEFINNNPDGYRAIESLYVYLKENY